jgi:hypothetical protein|tara:strand:- start:774 stop:1589 length:816 start_codon:yes stop_codon:yes gene_type:complete
MYKILKKIIPNYFKKIIIKEVDKNYLFSGWGMKSRSCPPWQYVHYKKEETYLSYFNNIQKELEKKITSSKFISNQFPINTLAKIKEFKWRHYTVCMTIKFLSKYKKKITLVEAGTADGFTAWFALKASKKEKLKINKFYLYDSWQPMKKKYLYSDEFRQIGRYGNNNYEDTKKNFKSFKNIKFMKGFIPQILNNKNSPKSVDWLHIDLNSAKPTLEVLNFFDKKLTNNSIILFDDYGSANHETARRKIDLWCKKRNGILFALATGQAIYFV